MRRYETSKEFHYSWLRSYLGEKRKMAGTRKRFIIGKLGLDSHDNGVRIINKWLMEEGYEVIYAGLYNTPQKLVRMAIEEDANAIGVSFLGGEHLAYTEQLLQELKDKDMGQVKLVLGGVIPPEDTKRLKEMGVDAVFTPGTMKDKILKAINAMLQ